MRRRRMTRLPFVYVLLFLSTCVYCTAQIPRPSLTCGGMLLGKVPADITLIEDPSVTQAPGDSKLLVPGVPLRILSSVGGGDLNGFRNAPFTPGTYPGVSQCSLNSGAVAATFNIPIALTIMNDGITYSI